MSSSKNLIRTIKPKLTDDLSLSLREGSINTFLNPYSYLASRNNIEIFGDIQHIFIDGILLVTTFKLLKIAKLHRVSFDFTSIADEVFQHCIEESKSIYFVGSKEHEIREFHRKISIRYPELNIIGYRNGYFSEDQRLLFSQHINSIQPNIVVVGMGTPKQEELLIYLKDQGWKGTGFTCGGFFHQTASSSEINYYPKFIDKLNLRWFYRIINEPKLTKRYLLLYPLALMLIIKDFIVSHPIRV